MGEGEEGGDGRGKEGGDGRGEEGGDRRGGGKFNNQDRVEWVMNHWTP